MNNALTLIETTLTGDPAIVRIQQALEQDEQKAKRYMANVLNHVENGSDLLKQCTPQSMVNCAVESINLELPIDSRQLCSLVPYRNKKTGVLSATLRPEWRGYVYKIKKYNNTADVQVGLVYEGDIFSRYGESGVAQYKHKPKNSFQSDPKKLIGAYCYISYLIAGEKKAICEPIGKDEIDKIRKKATTQVIWNEWYGEMAKKSAIRRASKLPFAAAIHELDELDNKGYDINQEATGNKADIWNEPQKEPGEDATDITPEATTEPSPPKREPAEAAEHNTAGSLYIITIEGKDKTDLESFQAARNYLGKVMSNHKTKASRVALMQENMALVTALNENGEDVLLGELQDIINAGSDEPKEETIEDGS